MTAFDVHASKWRKSRRSIGNGNCVQVAASPGTVMVRDSADFASSTITFPADAWRAFVAATKTPKPRGSK
jgi:Domain of unknown function (DUF397)